MPSALRSSTATVKAIVVWNSWSRQMRENLLPVRIIRRQKATTRYIRRHLYKPYGLPYCGGCTWTRIRGQPIIAITWHFSQQTLLEQCYWPNVVIVAPRAKSVCSFVSLVQTNPGTTSVCSLLKKNLNAPRPSEHPPVRGKKCQNV